MNMLDAYPAALLFKILVAVSDVNTGDCLPYSSIYNIPNWYVRWDFIEVEGRSTFAFSAIENPKLKSMPNPWAVTIA